MFMTGFLIIRMIMKKKKLTENSLLFIKKCMIRLEKFVVNMLSKYKKIMIICNQINWKRNSISKSHCLNQGTKMMSFFRRIIKQRRRFMIREWSSMIKLFNILRHIIKVSLILSKNGMLRLMLVKFQNLNLISWGVRNRVMAQPLWSGIKNDNFFINLIVKSEIWKRDCKLFIKVWLLSISGINSIRKLSGLI